MLLLGPHPRDIQASSPSTNPDVPNTTSRPLEILLTQPLSVPTKLTRSHPGATSRVPAPPRLQDDCLPCPPPVCPHQESDRQPRSFSAPKSP